MPPNKPQSNYSKGPVSRVRLLKIGPRTTKSLFEEYFYGFAVMISLAVTILGKAGGLSSYDAVVTGLWAGGFTWFAWQVRRYRKERASPGSTEKSREAVQPPPQMMKQPLPPIIGFIFGGGGCFSICGGAWPACLDFSVEPGLARSFR